MDVDGQDDVELVRRFKDGDERAFDEIVLRFQDRIYRLACVWLYDDQQAVDAAQEVFLRGYAGLRRFRFRATPFTWLYRTTRNVCNEFNRRRRPEPLDAEPVDDNSGPESLVSAAEAARRVRQLVGVLPPRQREVVVLRLFEELSTAETARAMGCREGTVKALLFKAMQRLKLDQAAEDLKP